MLVLTRKMNQSIMIGEGVEVKILGIAGEKVRIGISAPEDVSIFRDEVFSRIAEGDGAAANGNGAKPSGKPASRT